jgi:hypothetical protein
VANRAHVGGGPAPASLVFHLELMLGARIVGIVIAVEGLHLRTPGAVEDAELAQQPSEIAGDLGVIC